MIDWTRWYANFYDNILLNVPITLVIMSGYMFSVIDGVGVGYSLFVMAFYALFICFINSLHVSVDSKSMNKMHKSLNDHFLEYEIEPEEFSKEYKEYTEIVQRFYKKKNLFSQFLSLWFVVMGAIIVVNFPFNPLGYIDIIYAIALSYTKKKGHNKTISLVKTGHQVYVDYYAECQKSYNELKTKLDKEVENGKSV